MLRYLEGGIALAFLLGAVAACDGRTVLLNASAQSAGLNSLNPQGGARVNTGDAAMSAETVGRQAWGDSLAVLIEWHVDSVRRYEIRQCQPDDQPAEQMSELSEAVLDGPELPLHGAPGAPASVARRTGDHLGLGGRFSIDSPIGSAPSFGGHSLDRRPTTSSEGAKLRMGAEERPKFR